MEYELLEFYQYFQDEPFDHQKRYVHRTPLTIRPCAIHQGSMPHRHIHPTYEESL